MSDQIQETGSPSGPPGGKRPRAGTFLIWLVVALVLANIVILALVLK